MKTRNSKQLKNNQQTNKLNNWKKWLNEKLDKRKHHFIYSWCFYNWNRTIIVITLGVVGPPDHDLNTHHCWVIWHCKIFHLVKSVPDYELLTNCFFFHLWESNCANFVVFGAHSAECHMGISYSCNMVRYCKICDLIFMVKTNHTRSSFNLYLRRNQFLFID